MLTRKMLTTLLLLGSVGAGLYTVSVASAGGAGAPITAGPTDAQTVKIVNAANAFLASLTPAQQQAVSFAFSDETQRKNWTNFPDGGSPQQRKGVKWGELNATQRQLLTNLLGAVLSPSGLKMVQEQMNADDEVEAYQAKQRAAGLITGPGGAAPTGTGAGTGGAGGTPPTGGTPAAGGTAGGTRPQVNFGSAHYFVSFLGTPSETSPWMLQFGGHHLAVNATVVGPNVSVTPLLTGGEPLKYTKDGKAIYIVSDEAVAADSFLKSLTAAQRTKAIQSAERTDLVLGPGQDGKVLQPEGLLGSELTAQQRGLLLNLIGTRLKLLNPNDAAPKLAAAERNLSQTSFSWYGPTALGAGYFRIVGPTLNIEFSPQANDGDATDHAHNIYREPGNDYGAAWTK